MREAEREKSRDGMKFLDGVKGEADSRVMVKLTKERCNQYS